MLNFYNKTEEAYHKIEIFGEIGDSFWGDGVTLQSFASDLKNAESKPLNILINSLGGDVDAAFAIHDLIKSYPNKKTCQIIGMSASSAINIAVACDTVEMSKNALALIHNCSMMVAGNAQDFEKAAEECGKVDDIIVSLYKSKSGKPKSVFYTEMAKEQWKTAKEMKELGLVDKIIEPANINNSVYDIINNSVLPKIKIENNMEKTWFEKLESKIDSILNKIGTEKPVDKAIETPDFTAITNEVSEIRNELITLKTENETLSTTVENHVSEITTLKESVTAKDAAITAIQNEFAEYAKAQGKEVTFDNGATIINNLSPVGARKLSKQAQKIKDHSKGNFHEDSKSE